MNRSSDLLTCVKTSALSSSQNASTEIALPERDRMSAAQSCSVFKDVTEQAARVKGGRVIGVHVHHTYISESLTRRQVSMNLQKGGATAAGQTKGVRKVMWTVG